MIRICLIPQVHGVGGMVSFRAKFAAGLAARGIEVTADLRGADCDAVLVIGGTRDLPGLWRARRRGVPVIQRLDGMNWLHKRLPMGWRHYLRAEYGNWNLQTIRSRLATGIVYQSEFSRRWWERVYGPTPIPNTIVHNGVDLAIYTPRDISQLPADRYRLLLVEGSLMGGYEMGLKTAVALVERLNNAYSRRILRKPLELIVAGRVSDQVEARWAQRSDIPLVWAGQVPYEKIPELDRSAHLLYSSDINAACPNAVIEALACGTPVLAFDTGALPELVTGDAGRVVPYGGEPWNLDPPNVNALAEAAIAILHDQPRFRTAARAHAEAAFGLEKMMEGYLQALLD